MRFVNAALPAGGLPVAPKAADAVLVVDSGGRRYAFELGIVAEIRGSRSGTPAANATPGSRVERNGVRVPVFCLDGRLDACTGDAGALVVLDLRDRLAAVAVDAVREVRIAHTRSPVAASAPEPAATLSASVAWVAVWEGGEAPVLDVAAWLHGFDSMPQLPAQAAG